RRMSEPLEAAMDFAADAALEPDNALSREDTVRTAVSRFLQLPPAQRSCVILKDVLEYSLEEIAAMLELSVPAIKAALHRGRRQLRELSETTEQTVPKRTAHRVTGSRPICRTIQRARLGRRARHACRRCEARSCD